MNECMHECMNACMKVVVLKQDEPKHGLQPGERCRIANIDSLKKIVYVARLSDDREFGPFRHVRSSK